MSESIKQTIARYRQGAMATGDVSDPRKANKGAKQVHACNRLLRESKEGREALCRLMEDAEPSVRCWAAAECLQWKPDLARQVLESLRDSRGPFAFDATMTLEEHKKGRLKFDH